MPNVDDIRAQGLVALAKDRYAADLSEAEIKVLTDSAACSDPGGLDSNAPRPEVRAGLIRWMLTDQDAAKLMDAKGLRARCVTVTGDLDLGDRTIEIPIDCWVCDFTGQIILDSARTKAIYLTGGTLEKGLTASAATVGGLLSIVAVVSKGTVNLERATIQGSLDLSQSQMLNEEHGLVAYECNISGNVHLRQKFYSAGPVELYNARIAGNLDCSGADVGNLSLYNATIQNEMFWLGITNPSRPWLDLSSAKVKRLRDDKESWPAKGSLVLTGFQFEELVLHQRPNDRQLTDSLLPAEIPFSVDDRADWFLRQSDEQALRPQIWMYFRDKLEANGDDEGARHTDFRFQLARAQKQSKLTRWRQIAFAWLQESPLRILYTIVLVVAAGWAVFGYAAAMGAMAPTDHEAYTEWARKEPIGSAYPKLNPLMYSLENALPLVKLGQDDKWAPDPNFGSPYSSLIYALLVWSRWFLILSGWVQATVLAAALSSRFKS